LESLRQLIKDMGHRGEREKERCYLEGDPTM